MYSGSVSGSTVPSACARRATSTKWPRSIRYFSLAIALIASLCSASAQAWIPTFVTSPPA